MIRLIFLILLTSAPHFAFADDVALPGPGAPPTQPPPPQPTPPPTYDPSPPPDYGQQPRPTPAPEVPGEDTTYVLGSGSVGRFKERVFKFRTKQGLANLRALRIQCTHEKIRIKSVLVRYKDGRSESAMSLATTLSNGDSRIAYLSRLPVAEVQVTAASSSIFKKNGAFRLDGAASRSRN